MIHRLLTLGFLCLGTLLQAADTSLHRYLYMSAPDAAQPRDQLPPGVFIFDLDHGHRLDRFVTVTNFAEGLRGFCPSLVNHAAYYSTTSGLIGAWDLQTEQVIWEKRLPLGVDRACVTQDGKTIYAPTGWWYKPADGGFYILDAKTGKVRRRVICGGAAHNSLVTPDGQYMLMGGSGWFDMYRADDATPVWRFTELGDHSVFPFTVDSRHRYAYVCQGRHVGFEVLDLVKGNRLHIVRDGNPPHERRTHGVALTPDETEVWISDQVGKRLVIFDNTGLPEKAPTYQGEVALSRGGHGWVTFSLDGRYAWCHTPDVIDVKTRRIVATLKDAAGKPVMGSKFFEAHFRDGRLVRVGNQFGLGWKHATP